MSSSIALDITGMSCGHCVASVERALRSVPGIEHVAVQKGRAEFAAAPTHASHALTMAAVAAVRDAGFQATPEVAPARA